MAVIDFYEVDKPKGGTFTEEWTREYSRFFVAISNSALDAEPEVWAHPLCPVPRETITAWDRLCRCTKVSAKFRPKTRWRWDVEAAYSSLQFSKPAAENPLDDPAEIEIDTELVPEERYTDRNGKPTTNTAGDLIKVVVEIPRATISVQKNVALVNSWISDIAGIVNSAPIRINGKLYEPETLKVTKVRVGKVAFRNEIAYLPTRVEIREKAEGWHSPALNLGYNAFREHEFLIDGKTNKPIIVKDRCLTFNNEPEPEPVFLDKDGFRPSEEYVDPISGITKKRPKVILEPSDIVLLKLDMLTLYDFNRLPLR